MLTPRHRTYSYHVLLFVCNLNHLPFAICYTKKNINLRTYSPHPKTYILKSFILFVCFSRSPETRLPKHFLGLQMRPSKMLHVYHFNPCDNDTAARNPSLTSGSLSRFSDKSKWEVLYSKPLLFDDYVGLGDCTSPYLPYTREYHQMVLRNRWNCHDQTITPSRWTCRRPRLGRVFVPWSTVNPEDETWGWGQKVTINGLIWGVNVV